MAKIARVIRQDFGNVLMLGMGGNGQHSLARLSSFLTGLKLFEVGVSKEYSYKSW